MDTLSRLKTSLLCPGCKRDIEPTFSDLYSRKEILCRACGCGFKLPASQQSELKHSLADYEKALRKKDEAMQKLMANVSVILKMK